MKFALNYSLPARRLYEHGEITFDLFKLPAWPSLLAEVSRSHPCCVHFPLMTGTGSGEIINFEDKARARWEEIEQMMALSRTPLINIHLAPQASHHPDLPPRDTSPETVHRLTARLVADVQSAVDRFGAQHVIVENDTGGGNTLDACTLPEVICAVVEHTGCGFLLDLSHARIVARQRGLDEKAYLSQLPTHRLRELHLTGIQWLDDAWQQKIAASGMVSPEKLPHYRERWMDHLPFTAADWDMTAWALKQIHTGAWNTPWLAACEYGGIGGFFEATLDEPTLRQQMPRLSGLIKRNL